VAQQFKVFIDGQAGTTGLEISERLLPRSDIELLQIASAQRKDPQARRNLMGQADVTLLCLPDEAAREAVAIAPEDARILDASSAFRVANGWTYGCPELLMTQRDDITRARRVSNPGCYPQGFVLLIRPLIDTGLLSPAAKLRVMGVSGYSGGGRSLIEKYQAFTDEEQERQNTCLYSLGLQHKHVPEMHHYSGTQSAPLFLPSVGNFYRGILVQIPLFISEFATSTSIGDIHDALAQRYQHETFIDVLSANDTAILEDGYLNATAVNHSNRLQLMVYGNAEQVLLAARYDNLVKGAAGAAIQNLNLMLGVAETTGLTT